MRSAIKWIGIPFVSLITICGVIAAYVALAFNPNDYKADLIRLVHEKTGRTLHLKGDMHLTFFPTLGIKLREVSLSERNSDREFARVESATIAVKLLPLLSKQVIVDAIEVKGLRARIVRDKIGRYNFDDLTGSNQKKSERKSPSAFAIDIARISVSDGDIAYVDEAEAAQYRFSKLNASTGRIANGVTTPVDVALLFASSKHQAELSTRLKAKLTFDLQHRFYKLEALDFALKGRFASISAIDATAKGNIQARLETGELVAKGFTAAIAAKDAQGALNVKLDTPALTLTTGKVAGDRIVVEATRRSGNNKLAVKLSVAGVQGAFNALKTGPLEVDVTTEGERSIKGRVTGVLTANLEAKRLELPELKLEANVRNANLPKSGIQVALSGAARADLNKETAALDFSGKIDQSKVSGKGAVTKLAPLALRFDIEADQFDADRLLAAGPKSDRIDLSALEGLTASGTVRIGKLTLLNLKSSQVRADVKVANGRLNVAPLSARLYDGTLDGSLSAQAGATPQFAVKQTLTGVAVGPMLRDAAKIDTLEGKGAVRVDVTARGATVDALKKALNGTASVNLADGAIKGFDVAGALRGARLKLNAVRGEQVQQTNKTAQTDFSEMRASFAIRNGVAHNEDLTMKSPLLRVGGSGDLDIGQDRMNYVLRATLVATTQGQGGKEAGELKGLTVPVKLSGALESPQYAIDFSGMATELAKRQIQDELFKRTTTAQASTTATSSKNGKFDDAIKGLKSIFGR